MGEHLTFEDCTPFPALPLPPYISSGSWSILREHRFILIKEIKENSYSHSMSTHMHACPYTHRQTHIQTRIYVCMHTCNTYVTVNIDWQDIASSKSYISGSIQRKFLDCANRGGTMYQKCGHQLYRLEFQNEYEKEFEFSINFHLGFPMADAM